MSVKYRVGIDVGHSEDTWENTNGKGVRKADGQVFEEFHFNLKVSRKVKELTDADGRFIVFTAQPLNNVSKLVSLKNRVKYYNDNGCKIVFSNHANAHSNKNVKGHLVFYWHSSKNGLRLAKIWDNHADELLSQTSDKNIMACVPNTWTHFYIVHYTHGVCILPEHAFFTNDDDLKLLEDDDFITRCAYTEYYSLCDYYGLKYRSTYLKNDFKLEGLKYLTDNNFVNNYNDLSGKVEDSIKVWEFFNLIKDIHEDLNK